MKITANEIKPGMIIEHKNDLWNVLKTQHVKPGKGGAFNQVELKSILKGTKLNERFRSSENIEKADATTKTVIQLDQSFNSDSEQKKLLALKRAIREFQKKKLTSTAV